MHLLQHTLSCALGKWRLHSRWNFISTFTWIAWPWQWTLTNRSDIKDLKINPRCHCNTSLAVLLSANKKQQSPDDSPQQSSGEWKVTQVGVHDEWLLTAHLIIIWCCKFCWVMIDTTILVKSNGALSLFWQLHHSFPPPPPYNVGSVRSKCPPWSKHCMGGRGEGQVWEKSRFHHRTGGDNENIANFQGVPYRHILLTRIVTQCVRVSQHRYSGIVNGIPLSSLQETVQNLATTRIR